MKLTKLIGVKMTMRNFVDVRMPEINRQANLEVLFKQARQAAASHQPRQVVVVTPERTLANRICPPPGTATLGMTNPVKKIVPFEPPLNITVIGYTETSVFSKNPAACIPFFGYVMGMGYLGHNVVIFEGHEAALPYALKEADMLLVDDGMSFFLPANWTQLAQQSMRTPRVVMLSRSGKIQTHPLRPLAMPPTDFDSALKDAHRLAKTGHLNEAVMGYTKALELNPNSEHTYYNRGFSHLQQGNLDRAIEDFSKALSIKPTFFEALFQRGVAYAQKDNFQSAFSDFNQALKINRVSASAYFQRGKILMQKQKFEAAIIDFSTAIQIKPTLEALLERAKAYEANQQIAEALTDYSQYLRAGGGKKLGNQAVIEANVQRLKNSSTTTG